MDFFYHRKHFTSSGQWKLNSSDMFGLLIEIRITVEMTVFSGEKLMYGHIRDQYFNAMPSRESIT